MKVSIVKQNAKQNKGYFKKRWHKLCLAYLYTWSSDLCEQTLLFVAHACLEDDHNYRRVMTEITLFRLSCNDLDECALGVHNCHPNAVCSNTWGSYSCSCLLGHHGNGKQCRGKQVSKSFTLTASVP